jgi:hypothetical protein
MSEAAAQEKAFRKTIDLGDGSGVQVFEADTAEGLADKLADAQANATRKISELSAENKNLRRRAMTEERPRRAEAPLPEFKGRALTDSENFEIGQQLQNPATAPSGARRLLEAELGAPIEEVRTTLRTARQMPQQMACRDAAEAFLMRHPEYVLSNTNQDTLVGYMKKEKMSFAEAQDYEDAFSDLSAAGLLQLRPAPATGGAPSNGGTGNGNGAPADSGEPSATIVRPRSTSTSVVTRPSGSPRGGGGPKMPTVEEIDRMSAQEHKRWITDPVHGARNRAHEERAIAERERAAATRRQ